MDGILTIFGKRRGVLSAPFLVRRISELDIAGTMPRGAKGTTAFHHNAG